MNDETIEGRMNDANNNDRNDVGNDVNDENNFQASHCMVWYKIQPRTTNVPPARPSSATAASTTVTIKPGVGWWYPAIYMKSQKYSMKALIGTDCVSCYQQIYKSDETTTRTVFKYVDEDADLTMQTGYCLLHETLDPVQTPIPLLGIFLRKIIIPPPSSTSTSTTGSTNESNSSAPTFEYLQHRCPVPEDNLTMWGVISINRDNFFSVMVDICNVQTPETMGHENYNHFKDALEWVMALYGLSSLIQRRNNGDDDILIERYRLTADDLFNEQRTTVTTSTSVSVSASERSVSGDTNNDADTLSNTPKKKVSVSSSASASLSSAKPSASDHTNESSPKKPPANDRINGNHPKNKPNRVSIESAMTERIELSPYASLNNDTRARKEDVDLTVEKKKQASSYPMSNDMDTDLATTDPSDENANQDEGKPRHDEEGEADDEMDDSGSIKLPPINPMDTWGDVKTKLLFFGWYQRSSGYYPNEKLLWVRTHSEDGAIENYDYFSSEIKLEEFIRERCPHWIWTVELYYQELAREEERKRQIQENRMAAVRKRVEAHAAKKQRYAIMKNSRALKKATTTATKSTTATTTTTTKLPSKSVHTPPPKTLTTTDSEPRLHSEPQATTVTNATTPVDRGTKSKDPAKPLLNTDDRSLGNSTLSSRGSLDPEDRYVWTILWKSLKKRGWKAVKSSNALHDWYYVLPKSKGVKNGTAGTDYFVTIADVIEYVKEKDAQRNHKKRVQSQCDNSPSTFSDAELPSKRLKLDDDVDIITKMGAKKRKKVVIDKVPASAGKGLKDVSSKSTKTSSSSKGPGASELRKQQKEEQYRKQHWWKYEPIPAFDESVWPVLQKLGYYIRNDKYHLPSTLFTSNDSSKKHFPSFRSAVGLRKYLCWKGIPNFNEYSKQLSNTEKEILSRWVRFANVPVSHSNSVATLQSVPAPRNDDTIRYLLYAFKFTSVDGKLFVPYADELPGGRKLRKRNVHYFTEEDLNQSLRTYVRGAWHLGLVPDTSSESDCVIIYKKPEKNKPPPPRDIVLQLSLWGATSSAALPTFDPKTCCRTQVAKYLEELECEPELPGQAIGKENKADAKSDEDNMEEPNEEASDSSSVDKDYMDNLSGSNVSNETKSGEKESVNRSLDNVEFMQCDSPLARKPSQSKKSVSSKIKSSADSSINEESNSKNKGPKPWYQTENLPSFCRVIWPILQKIGFLHSGSKGYYHPMCEENHQVKDLELRKHLCQEGIPDFETTSSKLDDEERENLLRWITFANVPVSLANSCSVLQDIRVPNNNTIRLLLVKKFGFQEHDGWFFRPGVYVNTEFRKLREGVHILKGLQGVRDFIRGAPEFHIYVDDNSYARIGRRGKSHTGTDKEELMVRLWAALSPSPIPAFKRSHQVQTVEKDESPKMVDSTKTSIKVVETVKKPDNDKDDKSPKATKKAWYVKEHYPDFVKDVWGILRDKCGFQYLSGKYCHPYFPSDAKFTSCFDLCKYLCLHGIPSVSDGFWDEGLTASEKTTLKRWISFANVKVTSANSIVMLQSVQVPSDSEVSDLLLIKFGFKQSGVYFYPPGSEPERADVQDGVHKFKGIDRVRDYIRSAGELYIEMEDNKYSRLGRRGKQYCASPAEELRVRLWAALSPTPLPTFEGSRSSSYGSPFSKLRLQNSPIRQPETEEPTSRKDDVEEDNLESEDPCKSEGNMEHNSEQQGMAIEILESNDERETEFSTKEVGLVTSDPLDDTQSKTDSNFLLTQQETSEMSDDCNSIREFVEGEDSANGTRASMLLPQQGDEHLDVEDLDSLDDTFFPDF